MSTSTEILQRNGDIDLRVLAARLWDRRWWMLVSAVVFTAAFAAAAFWMTPIYRASTVLMPASADRSGMGSLSSTLGQLGGLAALAGISVGSDTQVEESLAVLRSREFTEGFIRDNDLMPELFRKHWDESAGRWKGDEEKWPTLAKAAKYFDESVREIAHDRKTGLVILEIDWRDPVKAARWANELVARVNAEMRSRAIARTNAAVGFLQKELAATSAVDTREAINRLMEAQINERMFANVTHEYVLRVVDRAMPPDPDDVVRPKKAVMLALGLGFGLMFGAFGVLMAAPARAG